MNTHLIVTVFKKESSIYASTISLALILLITLGFWHNIKLLVILSIFVQRREREKEREREREREREKEKRSQEEKKER